MSTTSVVVFTAAMALVAWHLFIAQQSFSSGCVMTYMRPQYVPTPITDQRRGYSLERYTEGTVRATERTHLSPKAYGPIICLIQVQLFLCERFEELNTSKVQSCSNGTVFL